MNILVCVSVVPDTTTKITFTEGNSKLNEEGVQFIINPYDELALTRALELTEQNGGEVTVIHVGLAKNDPSVRKALAIGAHKAVRVDLDPSDAFEVATHVANFAKDKNFDLILTGRESIDFNSGQVAGLLGEMLGLPHINVITNIDVDGNSASLTRDIDGGREVVSCELPLVASAQKDLVEPRIPNMRGIMAARTKPLEVVSANKEEVSSLCANFELPKPKSAVKLISADQPEELIKLLKEEAKII
jgi:electron transfer flavoprotein beta subunit